MVLKVGMHVGLAAAKMLSVVNNTRHERAVLDGGVANQSLSPALGHGVNNLGHGSWVVIVLGEVDRGGLASLGSVVVGLK